MHVVHDIEGKGKKPQRVVDDGKEEKLEPLKAEVLEDLDEEKNLPKNENQQHENISEIESQEEEEEIIAQSDSEEDDIPQTERKKKKKTYQDRINELVKRANDAERERNKLYTVNQSLTEEMQKMQPDFQKAREDLYESKKKSAEDALATARADHKTAYESGDSDKLLEVSEKIADLKYELKNLESSSNKPIEQSVSEKTSDAVSNTPKPQVDPKALRWSQENTWFGKDVAMTGAAYGIDNQLKNEGYDPTSDAYYAEIDRRMRDAFPSNFAEDEPRQVVAGVNRATRSSTSKRVRLSEGQIAMAKRLGVPNNEYAKFVKEQ